MSTAEARRAAVGLIRRGVAPIPVPGGSKNPSRQGWEVLRISEEEVPDYWTNGQNVGVLCGEPSGWRVDVDLDADEAVKVAGRFLPPTLTSGRESRPHSHWWYVAKGAVSQDWKAPNGEKLVELRSTGRQTIVAGTHPDRDAYVWHPGLEMAEMPADELAAYCRELATAALVARYVPPAGGRHDFALALAGILLRPGRLDEGLVLKLLDAGWHAAGADSREAVRDLEGIVRDTAARIEDGERVVGGPTLEESASGIVKLLCKWWGWERKKPSEEGEEKEEKATQAQLLVRCAEGTELFHTPGGDAYAAVPATDHRETHLIKSKGFRRWVVREYYADQGRPPGAQAMQDALGLLEARAQFDGPEAEVYVRVAGYGGAIYVDLANAAWEAVEITRSGWRIVSGDALPVKFRRPRGMLPLPTPTMSRDDGDGPDDLLRKFINLEPGGTGLRLVVAWLLQALRPTGPYPALILQGEQGSAKSTAEKLLRSLVDPSTAPLRSAPRNERDLIIAATNSWCLALDNISIIPPWCSDALCRLSTGGGFSARELYSDSEEVLFEATRPVILNGITDVATRPDLLDRAILVNLPRIPAEERRSEAELWRAFEEVRPRILGGLFDALSGALGTVESVRLEGMPRMADFAVWATAAEGALGWESGAFLEAYADNRSQAAEGALEADPVATALQELMSSRGVWTGTAAELWDELNDQAGENTRRSKAWPGAPNVLSGRIKRLAPALRDAGIEYRDAHPDEDGRKRAKSLQKVGANHRPDRPHRPDMGEMPVGKPETIGTMVGDDGQSGDHADRNIVPDTNPVDNPIGDASDGKDDEDDPLRTRSTPPRPACVREILSQPPGWLQRQMAHCRNRGNPVNQLKALAASVAAELYGHATKGAEILPEVEALMTHGVGCSCEVCR